MLKHTFNVVEEIPMRDGYCFEQAVTVDLSHKEEMAEAQRAFVEECKAAFKRPQNIACQMMPKK